MGRVDAWMNLGSASQMIEMSRRSTVEQLILGLTSCAKARPYGQLSAIVKKYMADHPEKWHDSMADLVFGAISAACAK